MTHGIVSISTLCIESNILQHFSCSVETIISPVLTLGIEASHSLAPLGERAGVRGTSVQLRKGSIRKTANVGGVIVYFESVIDLVSGWA